ncbi:hypothetical protein MMC17_007553 [Xylographa soralifera]|nr:hypothetical protein [Xylographa soralifera]
MASFGKAIASGITNIAEIAPNLVNLNFNFTLYKVEAPVEFQGVGEALSHLRRTEAEAGRQHVTARALGALFVSLVPKTPKLFALYGLRASEISRSCDINPVKTKEFGFFSNRVRADATTVWAAATSGPGAIADPSEATSIWTEIVKRRSEAILSDFGEGAMVDFGDVAAAKNTLSREQLAEWDGSARAWLCAADRVKAFEQKQLMLILDNIRQEVNSTHDTYESVIKAWQESLTIFEALINGVSQRAKSGELLLALSAWHLYPDLMIVEPCPKKITQKDSLFLSCGILTIGLHRTQEDQGGLCWSLPLAQLRHYGPPVHRERTVNSTQRLTLDEFSQVFLGSFLHGWGDRGNDTFDMIRWLHKVSLALKILVKHKNESTDDKTELEDDYVLRSLTLDSMDSWLGVLFHASKLCVQASEIGDQSCKQMLRLGRRCANSFLGDPLTSTYFGLPQAGRFISCAKSNDNRVDILRAVAAKLPGNPGQMLIRVRCNLMGWGPPVYEYTTAKPMIRASSKRSSDGSHQPCSGHQRWIYKGTERLNHTDDKVYFRKLVCVFPELLVRTQIEKPTNILSACSSFIRQDDPKIDLVLLSSIEAYSTDRRKRYLEQGEDVFYRESCTIEDFRAEMMGVFWPEYASMGQSSNPWFERIYGDESVALFADSDDEAIRTVADSFSLESFHEFFDSSYLDPLALSVALTKELASADYTNNYWKSLKAVSSAASLYTKLKTATIDVRVLEHQLWESPWLVSSKAKQTTLYLMHQRRRQTEITNLTDLEVLKPYRLDLKAAFSCICFFESGRFQIQPENLQNVMAMCSNDLLWVAACLVDDPASSCLENEQSQIRVFPGNIGRSGIAFLVPPVDPMTRPSRIQDFRDIHHRPFEGHLQNYFQTTSLHLSFTTAESPLGDHFSGMKDNETYLLETLLSVHEAGEWVADLDLLKSFASDKYITQPLCEATEHTESYLTAKLEASCIDNWAELLDPPETRLGIVRACGSWQARLATFTIAVALGRSPKSVIVLSNNVCWDCLRASFSSLGPAEKVVIIA